MKKITILVGSFRKNSFNHQLAEEIVYLLNHQAEVSILDYQSVPFFNEDVEYPLPDSVKKVKEEISESDGLWIISPEYNGHVPGVLKNLFDWLSRPIEKGNWSKGSVVKQKPVTISSVAGKSAGIHVRKSLFSLLEAMRMNVIGDLGTGIVLSSERFSSQELKLIEKEKDLLVQQINQFLSSL